ncbi:MAG: Gfo/Idh/MocA family oxidoreductase [Sphingobacteriaceae bacterium]|nr:Gfo/Idh/MocA family oxidoreductase [Sphingobacteriaceae bacterium]
MKKVSWGILSTATIGLQKVIPAMQAGEYCEINAIASRNLSQAQSAAKLLNIPKAYGSYESLLNDTSIDAVYIPLPNNLHIPWTVKALQAGKHVLCEKPVGLSAKEAAELIETASAYPNLKVMEAFMYRFHPQWQFVKKLADDGSIGTIKTIQAIFSYFNIDPQDIRNKKEAGGGGLMDIGCYCISQSRFVLGKEPLRVQGLIDYDEVTGVDRMASAMMDFGTSTSSFTCSTQLAPFQNFRIFGTKGLIEIEIPVNIPPDKKTRIWVEINGKREEFLFEPHNQYTLQGDLFSKAIMDNSPVPTSLQDALYNMKVIEAIKESDAKGVWINL